MEELGLGPPAAIAHATIYRRPSGSVPQTLVVLNQIYASHYFQAALKVMSLIDDAENPEDQGFYLVYLDRSLFDSKIGGLKRHLAENRLRAIPLKASAM